MTWLVETNTERVTVRGYVASRTDAAAMCGAIKAFASTLPRFSEQSLKAKEQSQ